LSVAYQANRQYQDSLNTLLEAHDLEENNLRVMHDIGVTLRNLGKAEEASIWFQKILNLVPDTRMLGDYLVKITNIRKMIFSLIV